MFSVLLTMCIIGFLVSPRLSHDSSCFRNTHIYEKLNKTQELLCQMGYFILGNSAYAIGSFLLPPYDQPTSRSFQDNFNVFHSSARITVECAFGEIDLRWGIFWKSLACSWENATLVIEGAMYLYNYIVDYRNQNTSSDQDVNPHSSSEESIGRQVFELDLEDNVLSSIIMGQDSGTVASKGYF